MNYKTRLYSETANLRQGVGPQLKVIRDSNPDSYPDVCRIAAKMWIRYVVGVSHFTECRKSRPVKSTIPHSANGERSGKVIEIRIRDRITIKS